MAGLSGLELESQNLETSMVFIEWLACVTLSLNFEDLKTCVVFVEQLACVTLNLNLET